MAENGIRQLGLPRIGHFADKLRPEPMHCEVNAWQHYIDLLYLEAVRRGIGLYISHFQSTVADVTSRDIANWRTSFSLFTTWRRKHIRLATKYRNGSEL